MKFSSQYFLFPVLILLSALLGTSFGEVVTLDDKTFEHQTQASTGMTTGSWLVLFKTARCPHCAKLQPEFDRLSEDEELMERGVVLATVDIGVNPSTANRFMIRGSPTLLYLHKKKLYAYKGKRDFDALKEFIMAGFMEIEAQEIPTPPSQVEFYIKMAKAIGLELKDAVMGKAGMAGYAILVMVGMLLFIVLSIIRLFTAPAEKTKSS